MMKSAETEHYTELELEAAARDPSGELEGKEHLRTCSACDGRLEFFSRFYRELERELSQPVDTNVQRMADTLGFERTLVLHPFRAQVDVRSMGASRTMQLMASQTASHETIYQMSVATFAIESARVLARVVKDRVDNRFRIHIISEDPAFHKFVLVGVDGPGKETPFFATNTLGVGVLPSTEPRDWTLSRIVVLTPVVSFLLSNGLTDRLQLIHEEIVVTVGLATNGVTVTIAARADEPVARVMAISLNGTPMIRTCEAGRVSFSTDEARMVRELKLFP